MVPSNTPAFEDGSDHGPLFFPMGTASGGGGGGGGSGGGSELGGDAAAAEDAAEAAAAAAGRREQRVSLGGVVSALKEVQHLLPAQQPRGSGAAAAGPGGGDGGEALAAAGGEAVAGEEAVAGAVSELLGRLALTKEEWATYCSPSHFSEFNYTRNLVYLAPHFSIMVWGAGARATEQLLLLTRGRSIALVRGGVLRSWISPQPLSFLLALPPLRARSSLALPRQVLCWSPGQATPPHSHGAGRRAWVRVLQGRLKLEALGGAAGGGEPIVRKV